MIPCRILFVGELVPGSRTLQRIAALKELGHEVETLSTAPAGARYEDPPSLADRIRHRLRRPADKTGINAAIRARAGEFDALWAERVLTLHADTLRRVKAAAPWTSLVWYAEDDMMNPVHRSLVLEAAMPLFDLWVTTKSFNAAPREVPALGVRRVLFVNNSYDPAVHRPRDLDPAEAREWGAAIAFVGTYEAPRAESLKRLAERGLEVRVWGNGWAGLANAVPNLRIEGRPVYDDEYAKVVSASSINLGFLRKANRDLQTCRSIEIPAIGGFMLHERTDEMLGILTEDVEAAYFESDEELAAKCETWLANPAGRAAIAEAGHARVTGGGFSHADRVSEILEAAGAARHA